MNHSYYIRYGSNKIQVARSEGMDLPKRRKRGSNPRPSKKTPPTFFLKNQVTVVIQIQRFLSIIKPTFEPSLFPNLCVLCFPLYYHASNSCFYAKIFMRQAPSIFEVWRCVLRIPDSLCTSSSATLCTIMLDFFFPGINKFIPLRSSASSAFKLFLVAAEGRVAASVARAIVQGFPRIYSVSEAWPSGWMTRCQGVPPGRRGRTVNRFKGKIRGSSIFTLCIRCSSGSQSCTKGTQRL